MSTQRIPVVMIDGDGIGPEIAREMRIAVDLATGYKIDWIHAQAGLECAEGAGKGNPLPRETIDLIRTHKVAIKGPTTTPSGGGFSSINVALRRIFELHSCVRPAHHIEGVPNARTGVNMIVVREGTEGFYDCEEMVQEGFVVVTSRFSADAFRRTVRYAIQCAIEEEWDEAKITLVLKTNILKRWGAMYQHVFNKEIAACPVKLKTEYLHVDAAVARMIARPETFNVIVTENLFGDMLSDAAAALVGGLGVAPGGCIGDEHAIFEAVHGSAPDIAGQGIANPTALMLSACMMLRHLDLVDAATRLEEAIVATISKGLCTRDLGGTLSTLQFGDAVREAINRPL